MSTECYPIATLPHTTKLFRNFLAMADAPSDSPLRRWYGSEPLANAWVPTATQLATLPAQTPVHRNALADALTLQARSFAASPATLANIERLRAGARAIVTGQQVGLFGGPLLTLLKAATAVARASQATTATGVPHVPIFWLATEDHDLDEINQASFLTKSSVETLHLISHTQYPEAPVGRIPLDPHIDVLLEQACDLLGHAPICDLLRACYGREQSLPADSNPTFASAFARLITRLFTPHGLIVLDAAGRDFHTLGASTLRHAIQHAESLEAALLARSAQLESSGYHAQVLVKPSASLLFLLSEPSDPNALPTRQLLHRLPDGSWKAGNNGRTTATTYTTADLLSILDAAPERLSPNALLRPVFQDTILPTTAYIGGPSEVAYFAQSAVLYNEILGRVTPILPRLSATLIEPAIAAVTSQHELSLPDALTTPEALAQRLGARAMPIEAKRRIAAAGNALDEALTAAQSYLATLDPSLGRSAEVSASKMRYQMDRLRRLAATFELNKDASLRKHADAIALHLYPNGQLQERVLAGVHFLAAAETALGDTSDAIPTPPPSPTADTVPGAALIRRLVTEAATQCPGHLVIRL